VGTVDGSRGCRRVKIRKEVLRRRTTVMVLQRKTRDRTLRMWSMLATMRSEKEGLYKVFRKREFD
jgi:hypothetical protein